jgi:hypothetical protein
MMHQIMEERQVQEKEDILGKLNLGLDVVHQNLVNVRGVRTLLSGLSFFLFLAPHTISFSVSPPPFTFLQHLNVLGRRI